MNFDITTNSRHHFAKLNALAMSELTSHAAFSPDPAAVQRERKGPPCSNRPFQSAVFGDQNKLRGEMAVRLPADKTYGRCVAIFHLFVHGVVSSMARGDLPQFTPPFTPAAGQALPQYPGQWANGARPAAAEPSARTLSPTNCSKCNS